MKKDIEKIIYIILLIILIISSYQKGELLTLVNRIIEIEEIKSKEITTYGLENIPDYSDQEYIIINNNEPTFTINELKTSSFESYSDLDELGRCGQAIANIGIDIMPTEERGNIGMIKPSGWHTIKYDFINGKYLYNRCHLIGYQLTGENANEKNLITCTKNMNTGIMKKYENKVASYIKKTNNHVLYRVTPFYEEENLLSKGVQIEALSVEDNGEGIKFNIFIYNVQEGVTIDYKTGKSYITEK